MNDAMMFLWLMLPAAMGVAFLALVLKLLDLQEQNTAAQERKRTPGTAPAARSLAAKVPAFFGTLHATTVPPAALHFHDRLPTPDEIDDRHIRWALDQAEGNHAHAAALLGTSEITFELLVTRHFGDLLTPDGAAEMPREATIDDSLFAFIQNHIWAEQAVVSEFVHLPSIDSLYRSSNV